MKKRLIKYAIWYARFLAVVVWFICFSLLMDACRSKNDGLIAAAVLFLAPALLFTLIGGAKWLYGVWSSYLLS